MTSPGAFDNFNDFLNREVAERRAEKWKKLGDSKYRIAGRKKRKSLWKRISSRLSGK